VSRVYIPWPDNYFAWRHELMLLSGVELIMLMSLGMLLGIRPLWLEKLWGGLDKMYRLHRRLGIAAGLMLAGHWLLDLSPRWLIQLGLIAPVVVSSACVYLDRSGQAGGEWAAWVILGLVIIALLRMVPYGFWRKLHAVCPGLPDGGVSQRHPDADSVLVDSAGLGLAVLCWLVFMPRWPHAA
jgi:predicted ferric reductase